jgi:predicted GNAT family acetyltransferase
MHPLDNVIWHALTTRQAGFAESNGVARRFPADVTSLTGFSEPTSAGYASLADLLSQRGTGALFLAAPYQPREGLDLVAAAPLLQMVYAGDWNRRQKQISSEFPITELGAQDSREMMELTALTKPGPFGSRTHELGTYLGIRCNGKLVAMAGERLKVPGFTEVSAVCTHPDHKGKGFARILMMEILHRVRERGETPCLHVREDNLRAIELYERLGFKTRVQVHLAVLRRA